MSVSDLFAPIYFYFCFVIGEFEDSGDDLVAWCMYGMVGCWH